MHTRVQKWGNSLAVRIPKSFATEIGIDQDSEVELSLLDGTLVLVPVAPRSLTLNDLLAAITDENLHTEIPTGTVVGNESW